MGSYELGCGKGNKFTFERLEERSLQLVVLNQSVLDQVHRLERVRQPLLQASQALISISVTLLTRPKTAPTYLLQEEGQVPPSVELPLAIGLADVLLV